MRLKEGRPIIKLHLVAGLDWNWSNSRNSSNKENHRKEVEAMWGWKSVERIVEPAVSFEDAKMRLVSEGFRITTSHPHHVVLESDGEENPWTTLAPDGVLLPIELAVGVAQNGLFVHIRYRTLVLFDTGDLNRFADRIAEFLTQQPLETAGE